MLWVTLSLSLIYGAFANVRLKGPSENNHFAHLAQAWLHGQLHLIQPPPHHNDWASYEVLELKRPTQLASGAQVEVLKGVRRGGEFELLSKERLPMSSFKVKRRERRYFVSFPPLPALLMAPFVWFMGLSAPDTWLTLLFAVLNGVFALQLVRALQERGFMSRLASTRQEEQRALWLVALLTLGSAHLWCAVRGEVWYTALIIGVSAHLLYLRLMLGAERPFSAGLALSAAFATRPTLVLLSTLFYAQLFSPTLTPHLTLKERLWRAARFSLPPLCVGLLLLWHNVARFESPLEFGHSYLAGGRLERVATYGLFHITFLKKNLIAAFGLLPLLHSAAPWVTVSAHGMAIQASSPALFWALSPRPTQHPQATLIARFTLTVTALMLCVLLLYQNTGWVQFSWRFILDLLPSLVMIIALRLTHVSRWLMAAVLWGVCVNALGAASFGRSVWWLELVNLPLLSPQ
jgi:hypothetical protein